MDLGTTLIEVLISIIVIVEIIVNLLVIGIICKVPKLHKKESAFIISIAVSDILQALVSLFEEVISLNQSQVDILIFVGLCYYISYTTTIFSICGLSTIRYIRIKYTLRYHDIVTRKTVQLSILLVWIVPVIIFACFFILQIRCNQGDCSPAIIRDVLLLLVCVAVYLPCLLMIYLYCRLYLCCRRHLLNLTRLAPGCPQTNNSRAVRTIGAIMGSFLVCWMPKMVLDNVIVIYYPPDLLIIILKISSIMGPMVNALLYITMNNDFKENFKSLM